MDTPVESKSQTRALTTTSYGVLSVLAIGEHSTYELTRQMRRSLHYLWPRAESNVYAEPRRLALVPQSWIHTAILCGTTLATNDMNISAVRVGTYSGSSAS